MNTTAEYTKAMSNSGTIHLAFAETGKAACATGKVQPNVIPLTEAEQTRQITCKRCQKLALQLDSARIAAAASTAEIDALLDEVAGTGEVGAAIADAIRQGQAAGTITADEATSLAETAPEAIDEATASDTEAAEEAAERDAAEAAPAAAPAAPAQRKARINQADLVMAYLEANPGQDFTPHQVSKAVTPEGAKRLGLRDCMARLARDGKIEVVEGAKGATYRLPELPENATA